MIFRKAKEEYVKMRKERDYHRMHHNRIVQEKNKLIGDLKRMKTHYDTYEPLLKTMKEKYDFVMRDKVINQLERDKVVAELSQLKNAPVSPSNYAAEKKNWNLLIFIYSLK